MAFLRGRFRPLFVRVAKDTYAINLSDDQRELITRLLDQLRQLLGDEGPAIRRLFPEPYGDDAERNAGYAVLAGAELMDKRLQAIATVQEGIGAETVTETELYAWMRTINDLRLVMGTILDVSEDGSEPDDEDALDLFNAYEHLGFVLENLVAALAD